MIKKGVLSLVVILVLISLVLATDTLIEIKTIQNGEITLRVRDINGKIIPGAIYNIKSDSSGLASYNYSGPESMIKLSLSVKGVTFNDVETIFFDNPLLTGKKVYVDLTQGEPTAVLMDLSAELAETNETEAIAETAENNTGEINETAENNTKTAEAELVEEELEATSETESKDAESSGITGLAILAENKTITYSISILVVVAVLVFFFILFYKKTNSLSGLVSGLGKNRSERQLRDAEEKIKRAQAELNKIRNISKIRAAEEKLRKDKEVLNRLRRGEDA